MKNNTDARKAAEQFYESQRKLGFTESITSNDRPDYTLPFYQSIFSLMLEFAQSHRSLDKGEVSEEEIEKASMSTFEGADENDLRYGSWVMPFEAGVRWRESLSEQPYKKDYPCGNSESDHCMRQYKFDNCLQPEAKPTESEQVEKLKVAIESALRIENLWLPPKITSFGPFSEEHIALGNMKKLFLEALNSLKQ